MQKIPVLFTNPDSNYNSFTEFDTWCEDRNAFLSDHRCAAIYHPPCRLFSRLRKFSTAPVNEKKCAFWSLAKVRQFGGILEHPRSSTLWKDGNFNLSGQVDYYGGFLRSVNLSWFGFPAEKKTMLYFVGISPRLLPAIPISLVPPSHIIGSSRSDHTPELLRSSRSETPIEMISYFLETIKIIQNESTFLRIRK